MLQIFNDKAMKRFIFDDFEKMDDRQKNYTRKMYEYVLQQQQQQNYYRNMDYMPNVSQIGVNNTANGVYTHQPTINNNNFSYMGNPDKLGTNRFQPPINQPQLINVNPKKMMIPNHLDPKGGNSLGFQMNPVSKNRKK